MSERKGTENTLSRRSFLGHGAKACAILGMPAIVPASALGLNGAVAPSNRLTIGHIGCGKIGFSLRGGFAGRSQVVACADPEKNRLIAYKAYYEKVLADRLGKQNAVGVETYENYRDLLARDDIDGVIVGSPDHWHANMTIEACRAGKDVYCEKPLTHTVQEAYDVVDAVQRYGRVLQTGSMQRSWREFRFAVEMVRNGRIGRVHTINVDVGGPPSFTYDLCEEQQSTFNWDLWCGPSAVQPYNSRIAPPDSAKAGFPSWRYYSDYGGGGQCDFGAHMYDIAQWALGRDGDCPVEVLPPVKGDPDREHLTYIYDDGVKMVRRGITQFEGAKGGVEFIGDKGVIYVSRGVLKTSPGHLKDEPTRGDEETVYYSTDHRVDFLNCMKTRQKPICDETVGASTAVICHLGNIAERTGQSFTFDYAKGVSDNAFANRYLDPPKRAGYGV